MLAKFKSYLIRRYYGGFVDVCGHERERIVHARFEFCDRMRSIERLSSNVSLICIHLLGFEYLPKASSKQRANRGEGNNRKDSGCWSLLQKC